jgi:fucose permease
MPFVESRTRARSEEIILFVYFLIFGFGGSSWLVRLPDVREAINVSTSVLGWVLFAGAVGAMTSLISAGKYIARFGSKNATITGFTLLGAGQVLQALAVASGSAEGVAVGALVAGLGYGIGDVGINVEGADLEKYKGKSLLPQLHGAYSLGALAGAAVGTLAIVNDFSLTTQMLVIAIATTTFAWLTIRFMPPATGREHGVNATAQQLSSSERFQLLKSKRIIFLGLGIMGLSLAEGAANDWLALSVVDDYGLDTTMAGITYAIMMAAMVITRFSGGKIVDKFGRVFALRVLGTAGVIGILLVILSPTIYLAWIGAALWGAGVALGFPLFISAAADGPHSSSRVSTVTAFGYFAFLVGPPILGFIGEDIGLLNMFYILAIVVSFAVYFAGQAGPYTEKQDIQG